MKSRNALITAVAVAGVGFGSFGLAAASNTEQPAPPATEVDDDSDDIPLTGADLERASDAALSHTGEGTVSEAEVEDVGFEVEVALDDGTSIDVLLDADFNVTGQEVDDADDD